MRWKLFLPPNWDRQRDRMTDELAELIDELAADTGSGELQQ